MGALISIASLAIIMQCIKADQYLPKIEKKCLFGSRKLCHHIINNCKNLFPVCINWIGTFVVVQIFAFCRKCVIHAGRTITPRGVSHAPRSGVCLKDSILWPAYSTGRRQTPARPACNGSGRSGSCTAPSAFPEAGRIRGGFPFPAAHSSESPASSARTGRP